MFQENSADIGVKTEELCWYTFSHMLCCFIFQHVINSFLVIWSKNHIHSLK